MKTRQYLFSCFSCGSLLFIVALGVMYAAQDYQSDAQIAGGITGFFCWSLVPFIAAMFFGMMAWRNAAGRKAEARHEELIRTLRANKENAPSGAQSN